MHQQVHKGAQGCTHRTTWTDKGVHTLINKGVHTTEQRQWHISTAYYLQLAEGQWGGSYTQSYPDTSTGLAQGSRGFSRECSPRT